MSWAAVCVLSTLADAIPFGVVVDGVDVCLVRIGDELFAVRDECTHQAVPLSEGEVEDYTIECWMHGSRFNLRTGEVLNPPAVDAVVTYATRVVDGQVQLDVAG